MKISQRAEKKLSEMLSRLGGDTTGFLISGFMGTCRGSTPILEPVQGGNTGDVLVQQEPLQLYVSAEYVDFLATANLDYDPSFMGRGLFMTWEHQRGCPCSVKHR